MARGITAVVFLVAVILAMSVLSGIGYYSALGADLDVEGQNEDVANAADQLSGIGFGEGRSSSILEGPLAAVTPAVGMFQTLTTILGNTSGVVQLLYGVPPAVADPIEIIFRVAMVATAIYLIRSGSPI